MAFDCAPPTLYSAEPMVPTSMTISLAASGFT
jgi:hypothetical protein